MDAVYDLKDMLCEELEEYGKKDKLDVGGLEIVDKLAHTIKNLDKIIEKYDEEEYSGAKSVLTAAAMTYVVAMLTSVVQLIRLISIYNRRR